MNRKSIVVVGAIVVVVIAAGGVAVYRLRAPRETGGAAGTSAQPVSPTRGAVPEGVTVPDKGATNVPANVAVPTVVGQTNTQSGAGFRGFDIMVKGDAFVPDTVIVKAWDTADMWLTAADKDYDFTEPDYGVNVALPRGQRTHIQFGVGGSAGKFTFYCKRCGGPESGPLGYLVVVAK